MQKNIYCLLILLVVGQYLSLYSSLEQELLAAICWTQRKSEQKVSELLQNDTINVNVTNEDGATALLLACQHKSSAMVTNLLQAKADPEIPDRFGYTPLLVAINNEDSSIINLLIEAKVSLKESLFSAVSRANEAIIKKLIAAGANVDEKNNDGETPLHYALRPNWLSKPIVKALLQVQHETANLERALEILKTTQSADALAKYYSDIVELLDRHLAGNFVFWNE